MQLRPSIKLVQAGYAACLLLALAVSGYMVSAQDRDPRLWWLLLIPALFLLLTVTKHLGRRMVKLSVLDDRLRYESGFLSKTTRMIELAKVQDVRVDQTLGQRMIGVGDLSVETAGGASRIVIQSIDRPHEAADRILGLSNPSASKPNAKSGDTGVSKPPEQEQ